MGNEARSSSIGRGSLLSLSVGADDSEGPDPLVAPSVLSGEGPGCVVRSKGRTSGRTDWARLPRSEVGHRLRVPCGLAPEGG